MKKVYQLAVIPVLAQFLMASTLCRAAEVPQVSTAEELTLTTETDGQDEVTDYGWKSKVLVWTLKVGGTVLLGAIGSVLGSIIVSDEPQKVTDAIVKNAKALADLIEEGTQYLEDRVYDLLRDSGVPTTVARSAAQVIAFLAV